MFTVIGALQDYFLANYSQWLFVLGALIGGYFGIRVIDRYLERLFKKVDEKIEFDKTLELFIKRTAKASLWLILLILILANLGFDVSAFIAGLGVIGFILGFATKDVLSNLTAGLFILLTRPLKVGEKIVAAGVEGQVKEITVFSSILITKENEYVIVPNSKIWGGPIKNLSRLKQT